MYRISTYLFILFMLTACGGTLDIHSDSISSQSIGNEAQSVVIERHPQRRSPWIKTFQHNDLNIYEESAGSRHNDSFSPNRVKTPSGNIEIGVVGDGRVYYPEVTFTSEDYQKYFITWVCLPYPFVAIVDAKTSAYVGIDSYCPNCSNLIGSTLSERTQCLNHWRPEWIQPDTEHHFLPWLLDRRGQMYRNLCYAADAGVISAQKRLGLLYGLGNYGFKKDKLRSFVWYQRAKNNGDNESARWIEKYRNTLSSTDLIEAEKLLKSWQKGQCKIEVLGEWEPKYKLEVN